MRSLLFIPGDSPRKLEKGVGSGADALLIDLEDSIAPERKAEARTTTVAFLKEARRAKDRPRLFVRVNGLATGFTDDDLDAVVAAQPDGIMFPKAEGGAAVNQRLQVLDSNGRPIPGLYAVGQNGLGGMILWGHGLHIAWAMTSGRLAGRYVMEAGS